MKHSTETFCFGPNNFEKLYFTEVCFLNHVQKGFGPAPQKCGRLKIPMFLLLCTFEKTTLRKNYEEFESIFNVKRFQNQVRVVKQGIRLALFLKRLIRCDNHLQTIVNHEH